MVSRFDYRRSKETADRLIKRFGREGVLLRAAAGTGDPWNPGSGEPDRYPLVGVVTDYSENEVDGTLVFATDSKILVAPSIAVEPATSDRIQFGNDVYEVVRAKPLQPGATVILWEVQARS